MWRRIGSAKEVDSLYILEEEPKAMRSISSWVFHQSETSLPSKDEGIL